MSKHIDSINEANEAGSIEADSKVKFDKLSESETPKRKFEDSIEKLYEKNVTNTPEQKAIIAEEYALLQKQFKENPESVNPSLLPIEYSSKAPKDIGFRKPDKIGVFKGKVGNSEFVPNSPNVREHLAEYGLTGIEYRNDEPDFSVIASKQEIYGHKIDTTVEISNMTGHRRNLSLDDGTKRSDAHDKGDLDLGNFEKADNALADKLTEAYRNDGVYITFTGKDIQEYRENNNLTWHECIDMSHMQLIPTDIHKACPHTGGTALAKYLQEYGNYEYE